MADEAATPRKSSAMHRVVLWFVIAALLAAVWWLASERNERHYRVAVQGNALMVEKGRFFPTGTALAGDKMYAPVAIPVGEKPPPEREFDDQNELDRYL